MKNSPVLELLRDDRGAVGIIFALLFVPFIVFAALAIDIGYVDSVKSQMQNTADAAALAAAGSIDDVTTGQLRATDVAAQNMSASKYGTVLTSSDVQFGNWDTSTKTFTVTGVDPDAAKATVRMTAANGNAISLYFAQIININTVDVTLSAVAKAVGGGTACVLALSSSASNAVEVSGNANVTFNGCDVASNSDDDDSLKIGSNATLTADCVSVVGDTDAASPELTLTCDEAVTNAAATVDPYDGLASPTVGTCLDTNYKNTSGTDILNPGTYCGKFEVTGGTVQLNSGTYVIDDGNFKVSGGATLEEAAGGTGVTIILTDSDGDSPGNATVSGGANVTLAAPTGGTYSGVVFFQDKSSASGTNNKFTGGSTMNITGALYFPKEDIEFTGGRNIHRRHRRDHHSHRQRWRFAWQCDRQRRRKRDLGGADRRHLFGGGVFPGQIVGVWNK